MSGQVPQLHSLLRLCLEQAGYGHFVAGDVKRFERWMNRHDQTSRTQKDKWRREFSHGKVSKALADADHELGSLYEKLYDLTVDFGAHPNVRGAAHSMNIFAAPDGSTKLDVLCLNNRPDTVRFGLMFTAQVGLCALRIGRVIFPDRAIGLSPQLDEMSRCYEEMLLADDV